MGFTSAEGPWPGKAQFDALRRARQRDASKQIDYGYTRPNVISQGRHEQFTEQYAPQSYQPTPVYDGPVIQETTPWENAPLDQGPIEGAPPNIEVMPPPEEIQVTEAPTGATAAYDGPMIQESTPWENGAFENGPPPVGAPVEQQQTGQEATPAGTQVTTASAVQKMAAGLPTVSPAYVPTNAAPTSFPTNPYRQEATPAINTTTGNTTTGGLTNSLPRVNSLRPTPNAQFTTSWTADQRTGR